MLHKQVIHPLQGSGTRIHTFRYIQTFHEAKSSHEPLFIHLLGTQFNPKPDNFTVNFHRVHLIIHVLSFTENKFIYRSQTIILPNETPKILETDNAVFSQAKQITNELGTHVALSFKIRLPPTHPGFLHQLGDTSITKPILAIHFISFLILSKQTPNVTKIAKYQAAISFRTKIKSNFIFQCLTNFSVGFLFIMPYRVVLHINLFCNLFRGISL